TSRPRAALPALCATQITSWGIVYYAFPVLNPQITADTGWSTTATTAAFAVFTGPFPLLVGIAIVAGMVRGNLTLLQATAVTDRWGTAHYGRLSGLLAAPATIAAALAPFAGAALAGPLGGYPGLFAALALTSAAAALFAAGGTLRHPQHRTNDTCMRP
ncbi:hypothetical protein ACFVMB_01435, partial [Streptomyces rochei]